MAITSEVTTTGSISGVIATGAVVALPSNVLFMDSTDIAVVGHNSSTDVVETLVAGVDYTFTVTAGDGPTDASITVLRAAGIIANETWYWRRLTEAAQNTAFVARTALSSQALEDAFDRLTLLSQENKGKHPLSMEIPNHEVGLDMSLPKVSLRANKALHFDAAGLPLLAATIDSSGSVINVEAPGSAGTWTPHTLTWTTSDSSTGRTWFVRFIDNGADTGGDVTVDVKDADGTGAPQRVFFVHNGLHAASNRNLIIQSGGGTYTLSNDAYAVVYCSGTEVINVLSNHQIENLYFENAASDIMLKAGEAAALEIKAGSAAGLTFDTSTNTILLGEGLANFPNNTWQTTEINTEILKFTGSHELPSANPDVGLIDCSNQETVLLINEDSGFTHSFRIASIWSHNGTVEDCKSIIEFVPNNNRLNIGLVKPNGQLYDGTGAEMLEVFFAGTESIRLNTLRGSGTADGAAAQTIWIDDYTYGATDVPGRSLRLRTSGGQDVLNVYVQKFDVDETFVHIPVGLSGGLDGTTGLPEYDSANSVRHSLKIHAGLDVLDGVLSMKDGVTAPDTEAGKAQIYVDTADGDLKVKFGDGHVAVLAADS